MTINIMMIPVAISNSAHRSARNSMGADSFVFPVVLFIENAKWDWGNADLSVLPCHWRSGCHFFGYCRESPTFSDILSRGLHHLFRTDNRNKPQRYEHDGPDDHHNRAGFPGSSGMNQKPERSDCPEQPHSAGQRGQLRNKLRVARDTDDSQKFQYHAY
ncbi:MAG: hypothetical protein LBK55_11285 [Azoarcus sp.]|nr:hypothetical protein [Azoarcus sp.]